MATIDWQERLAADPNVLVGKLGIRGTRISVESVLDLLGRAYSQDDILAQYDHLTREDIQACLVYASDLVRSEKVYATP